jgi:hypothetical protein
VVDLLDILVGDLSILPPMRSRYFFGNDWRHVERYETKREGRMANHYHKQQQKQQPFYHHIHEVHQLPRNTHSHDMGGDDDDINRQITKDVAGRDDDVRKMQHDEASSVSSSSLLSSSVSSIESLPNEPLSASSSQSSSSSLSQRRLLQGGPEVATQDELESSSPMPPSSTPTSPSSPTLIGRIDIFNIDNAHHDHDQKHVHDHKSDDHKPEYLLPRIPETIIDSGTSNIILPQSLWLPLVHHLKQKVTIQSPKFWSGHECLRDDDSNVNDKWPNITIVILISFSFIEHNTNRCRFVKMD